MVSFLCWRGSPVDLKSVSSSFLWEWWVNVVKLLEEGVFFPFTSPLCVSSRRVLQKWRVRCISLLMTIHSPPAHPMAHARSPASLAASYFLVSRHNSRCDPLLHPCRSTPTRLRRGVPPPALQVCATRAARRRFRAGCSRSRRSSFTDHRFTTRRTARHLLRVRPGRRPGGVWLNAARGSCLHESGASSRVLSLQQRFGWHMYALARPSLQGATLFILRRLTFPHLYEFMLEDTVRKAWRVFCILFS